MGSATRTTSTVQTNTQKRAKQEMNSAVESDDFRRAADIGITVILATQPNGPAKVPMYSYAKHTATFLTAASEDGFEQGVVAAGSSIAKSEIAGGYAEMTVTSAQGVVSTAAENETLGRGVNAANKNLQMPSEQAAEDTLAAVMTNGADALSSRGKKRD